MGTLKERAAAHISVLVAQESVAFRYSMFICFSDVRVYFSNKELKNCSRYYIPTVLSILFNILTSAAFSVFVLFHCGAKFVTLFELFIEFWIFILDINAQSFYSLKDKHILFFIQLIKHVLYDRIVKKAKRDRATSLMYGLSVVFEYEKQGKADVGRTEVDALKYLVDYLY